MITTVSPPVAPVLPSAPVLPVLPVLPALPVAPVLPVIPVEPLEPLGPAGPAGPGTVTTAGVVTTVGRSQPAKASAAKPINNDATSGDVRELFIKIPDLDVNIKETLSAQTAAVWQK